MRDGLSIAAFCAAVASGVIGIWLGQNYYADAVLLFAMIAFAASHLLAN